MYPISVIGIHFYMVYNSNIEILWRVIFMYKYNQNSYLYNVDIICKLI